MIKSIFIVLIELLQRKLIKPIPFKGENTEYYTVYLSYSKALFASYASSYSVLFALLTTRKRPLIGIV